MVMNKKILEFHHPLQVESHVQWEKKAGIPGGQEFFLKKSGIPVPSIGGYYLK